MAPPTKCSVALIVSAGGSSGAELAHFGTHRGHIAQNGAHRGHMVNAAVKEEAALKLSGTSPRGDSTCWRDEPAGAIPMRRARRAPIAADRAQGQPRAERASAKFCNHPHPVRALPKRY